MSKLTDGKIKSAEISIKKSSPKTTMSKRPAAQKKKVLEDIHKKIVGSAALNGGFDILMFKIEKIEQNQEQLVDKVDKIHDAIYDPHDGIFSKINTTTAETVSKINETEQKLIEINEWKKQKDKEDVKLETISEESSEKIVALEKNVEDLQESKNSISGAVRWVVVAIAGGALTLLFKWLETKL